MGTHKKHFWQKEKKREKERKTFQTRKSELITRKNILKLISGKILRNTSSPVKERAFKNNEIRTHESTKGRRQK